MPTPKVLIVGVGNSGTRLLGKLVNELLAAHGEPEYRYEPLYWQGDRGADGIEPSAEGLREHLAFPLSPDASIRHWPWLHGHIDSLRGVPKFIRLGSRIRLALDEPVRVLWITRELYSYLGSMQQNFPRCLPDKGWHHRPGRYDDYQRVAALFPSFGLSPEEERRVEVEAAWWRLHNEAVHREAGHPRLHALTMEALCSEPEHTMRGICAFLGLPFEATPTLATVRPMVHRPLTLTSRNIRTIQALAGGLNDLLYPMSFWERP